MQASVGERLRTGHRPYYSFPARTPGQSVIQKPMPYGRFRTLQVVPFARRGMPNASAAMCETHHACVAVLHFVGPAIRCRSWALRELRPVHERPLRSGSFKGDGRWIADEVAG
jgi:hypothetical protein